DRCRVVFEETEMPGAERGGHVGLVVAAGSDHGDGFVDWYTTGGDDPRGFGRVEEVSLGQGGQVFWLCVSSGEAERFDGRVHEDRDARGERLRGRRVGREVADGLGDRVARLDEGRRDELPGALALVESTQLLAWCDGEHLD